MKTTAAALDRITAAAIEQLRVAGAANLTVGSVAKAAGISTALVHYHFASKMGLLRVASERVAAERVERRTAPLSGTGLDAVDALRQVLERDAATGAERGWQDVLLLARDDAAIRRTVARARDVERAAFAARLPALFASLGAAPTADAEPVAGLVIACLDGLALGLATGVPQPAFRNAYDAFWLALIGGAPARAHR